MKNHAASPLVQQYAAECFAEHDTRVLTNHGFLFLSEIEERIACKQQVLYASYDTSTESIVYTPGDLVKSDPPERWVDFTQGSTRRVWGATNDDYGSTVHGEVANRLTLRTTPEHDMYVQLCMQSASRHYPRMAGSAPIPPHKMKARELAPGFPCDCRAKLRPCTHGFASYRMFTGASSGLHPPADRISPTDVDRRSPVVALGLRSKDELDAFLELFGYWLGDGSMHYDTRPGLTSLNAVIFSPKKQRDRPYLLALLDRLHLKRNQHYTRFSLQAFVFTVRITDQRWFRFFDDEFGVKYSNSTHYNLRQALIKQGMHSSQRHPPPAVSSASATCSHLLPRGPPQGGGDPDKPVKSAKWMPDWVLFRLDARQLRLVIEGLRQADGSSAASSKQLQTAASGGSTTEGCRMISTSGVGFRDQLIHACLHAGFSAYFKINCRADEVRGYRAVPYERPARIYTAEEKEEALRADESREFAAVRGHYDNWWVCYSEQVSHQLAAEDVRFDGKAFSVRPKTVYSGGWVAVHDDGTVRQAAKQDELAALLSISFSAVSNSARTGGKVLGTWRCLTAVQYEEERSGQASQSVAAIPTEAADLYDEQRDGRVWCVELKQVKRVDRLIFVQRVHRNTQGVVTKVGRTMIVGNSLWNLALTDGANKKKLQTGEGIALVLAARRAHAMLFDVTHATNGLLDVLECSVAEEGKQEKTWEVLQVEAMGKEVEAVVAAMTAAPDDLSISLHGTDRLCALAAQSPALHPLLLQHLDAIFTALRLHPYIELIQVAGLNTLGRLASSPSAVSLITPAGGIAAALTALDPLPASSLLIENAFSLLRSLASEATNCTIIGRVGVDVVLEGIRTREDSVGVAEQGMRLLRVLVAEEAGREAVLKGGGVAVITRAVQLWFGRSVGLAEEALAVTKSLFAWAGAAVVTADLYWALLGVAQLFHWHDAIQRLSGELLPFCQPLLIAPPPPAQLPLVAGAVAPMDVGPPGGAAYGLSPPPTSTPPAEAPATELHAAAVEAKETAEVEGATDPTSEAEGKAEERGEEDEEEEEDEDEEEDDEEEPADEMEGDEQDVKEGEERPPATLTSLTPAPHPSQPLHALVEVDREEAEEEEVKEGKESDHPQPSLSSTVDSTADVSHLQVEEEVKEGDDDEECGDGEEDTELVGADSRVDAESDAAQRKRWSVGDASDESKVAAVDAT